MPQFSFPVLKSLRSRFPKLKDNPIPFLVAYFVLIPIFAVIYSVFATNHFVHSNLKLENTYQSDLKNSLLRVQQAIKETLQAEARPSEGYIFSDVENTAFKTRAFQFDLIFEPHPPLADSDARIDDLERMLVFRCENLSTDPWFSVDFPDKNKLRCEKRYPPVVEWSLLPAWFKKPLPTFNAESATASNFNTPEPIPIDPVFLDPATAKEALRRSDHLWGT